MQPLAQDFPVVPKADGTGFNILLKPTATAATLTPPPAPEMAPGGIGSDYARSPEQPQGAWVDDLMQSVGREGQQAQAQYETPTVPPPDMGGGPLSKMLPAGWGDTIASAAGGLNTIDRNQSPLAAFGAGLSGAMTTRDTRRKDKRTEMLQDELMQIKRDEIKYGRAKDVREEGRADTRLGMEQRRLDMADEAADAVELGNVLGFDLQRAQIDKIKLETERLAKQNGITFSEKTEGLKAVAAQLKVEFGELGVTEADKPAYLAREQQLKQEIFGQLGAAKQQGADTPAAASGDGSKAAPIKWDTQTSLAQHKAELDAALAAQGGGVVWFVDENGKVQPYTGKVNAPAPRPAPVAAAAPAPTGAGGGAW